MLGAAWPLVLDHLADAVLVLDRDRNLRFVNSRARRLLGYEDGQSMGSRCRLTTRGVDCDSACPLTFALERQLEHVEDFATVYRSKDGAEVPLRVTVIPIRAADGGFAGAVEILRPREPEPGFLLAGRGDRVETLRRRIEAVAESGSHVIIVGDGPACADVARTVHRFSGIADSLYHTWGGSWDGVVPWPPGTMFVDGDRAMSVFEQGPPAGWRVFLGVAADSRNGMPDGLSFDRIEVPGAAELGDDVPLILAAWIRQLAPEVVVHPRALERLSRIARDLGFGRLQEVLHAAVAAAGELLDDVHVPEAGYDSVLVDELLREPDPLSALERRLLQEVLDRSGWRMQEAADRLGISRVTLWRKLKDHGIERPPNGSDR